MTSVPPAKQPPIPPSTFSTALPIQPNYLSETCGNDLAWLHTFFILFLSLTFPLWTGPHLSRLFRRLPGRDGEVFPRRATNNNNNRPPSNSSEDDNHLSQFTCFNFDEILIYICRRRFYEKQIPPKKMPTKFLENFLFIEFFS